MSEDALVDEALAEMGRQARADEVCSICHASVRPDRRDRHLNWHASLSREIDAYRMPPVFGGHPPRQHTATVLDPLTTARHIADIAAENTLLKAQLAAARAALAACAEVRETRAHDAAAGYDSGP